MTKTKVRFHLAKGKHFKNWQVKCGDEVKYYPPSEVQLHMKGCMLRNQPSTAQKIYEGSNKTVCAWIECDEVTIHPVTNSVPKALDFLYYNPKRRPFWHCSQRINRDNYIYADLVTQGQLVAITKA